MRLRLTITAASALFLTGVVGLSFGAGEPDLRTGKDVFSRRCSGCHSPDINKGGPRLRGVLHRKAGTVEGFPYSDALRNSGFYWDEKRLNRWIENPEAVVKDTDMEFSLGKADERAAIVAYLKSLSE